MIELEFLGNDLEHVFQFNDLPDSFFDFVFESDDAALASAPVDATPPQKTSWIGEIENFLMKDDDDDDADPPGRDGELLLDNFLSDILQVPDSPADESQSHRTSPPAASVSDDNSSRHGDISTANMTNSPDKNEKENITAAGDDGDDSHLNPIPKKLQRQLRNRDAALRSRERKKLYVKDLEIKSRYLEAECRRLGRLLQCCYAENQMLRLSLQGGSAFGAPFAKQESAVLLLESLLLGSLLWFLGIMCLLPLPWLLQFTRDAVQIIGNVNEKGQESAEPRGTRSKVVVKLWSPLSYLRSKRCRASRTKMKSHFLVQGLAWNFFKYVLPFVHS